MTETGTRTAAVPAWLVVGGRELGDLWLSGRGLVLMLVHTAILSGTTYLVALNQDLNFLEQREAVTLTLQVACVVGGLLVLLAAADAISGERERGTLEALLLTPAPRRALLVGKALAALSLWLAAFAFALPYVWWLGRDVGTFGTALWSGLAVGSMIALLLAGVGLLVSIYAGSNLVSLSVSLFVLVALYAPNQMPVDALRGWAGELLLRLDPFTGALPFLDRVITSGHSPGDAADLLVVPLLAALLVPAVPVWLAGRLSLLPRSRS